MTDEQLLTTYAATHSGEVFAEFVRRYERRLFGFLWSKLHNPEAVRDRLQETFLGVHQSAERFRGGCKVVTWVYQIAKNCVINNRRRTQDNGTMERGELPVHCANRDPNPADVVAQGDELATLREAIHQLDHDESAVVCRELCGMTVRRIAADLGVSHGTVCKLRKRAVNSLREKLCTD